jgi:hypothetical protein
MRALAHAVWGDEPTSDCTRCVRDPGLREELGCDGPSPRALLTLVCGACAGRDPACKACGGAGKTSWRRCARRVAEVEQPRVGMVFRLFQYFDAHGVLPCAGGMADMPSELAHAFDILSSEKVRIENERIKNQEKAQEASKQTSRGGRGGALR